MSQIFYKTDEEIEILRESCLLVGRTLAEVAKLMEPGANPLKLDKWLRNLFGIMELSQVLKDMEDSQIHFVFQ